MGDNKFFARSTQSFEDTLDRSAPAFFASYGLVGAILLIGAIGYVLDWWLGTTEWLLSAGLAASLMLGFFGLLRMSRRQ
jgi:F0F1-type ATP synthase assembly protein I